jgi:hypothetical protein
MRERLGCGTASLRTAQASIINGRRDRCIELVGGNGEEMLSIPVAIGRPVSESGDDLGGRARTAGAEDLPDGEASTGCDADHLGREAAGTLAIARREP